MSGAVQVTRWFGGIAGTVLVVVLLAWMAQSGVQAHPDYLSYFNEFARATGRTAFCSIPIWTGARITS